MNFKEKTVWITGASSGIGRAVALEFSKQGAQIIISSRNKEKLQLVKNLCSDKDKVKVLPLDLDDYANFDAIVQEAIQTFGGVDILINNGGVSQRSLIIDTDISVDKQLFTTNYFGTVALTKALLPHFMERNNGHFVTVTSVVGIVATPLRSSYAASKHALHGFFDSLRAEVYTNNIAVTLVCPGYVKTDVSLNALTGDGSRQNTMDEATENGLLPEYLAKKLLKAVLKKKNQVIIGGLLEVLAVYTKRFFPKILANKIRAIKVT